MTAFRGMNVPPAKYTCVATCILDYQETVITGQTDIRPDVQTDGQTDAKQSDPFVSLQKLK